MAIEAVRGCGYRKVGALYLEGEYRPVACDRLPYPLETCRACGHGLRFSRTPQAINPLDLFGEHRPCVDFHALCRVCVPQDEPAFIIWIGERFYPTPADFLEEGLARGFSRRIQHVPKGYKPGLTVVYLAHNKAVAARIPVGLQQAMAIVEGDSQDRLLEAEQIEPRPGIFTAFVPRRIVKLVWESQVTDELDHKLAKQGITVKAVPDGDVDHK